MTHGENTLYIVEDVSLDVCISANRHKLWLAISVIRRKARFMIYLPVWNWSSFFTIFSSTCHYGFFSFRLLKCYHYSLCEPVHALFNSNIVLELNSLEIHPILSSFSSSKRFIRSIHMQYSFRGNFPFFHLLHPLPLFLLLSSLSSLPPPLSLSHPTLLSRIKLRLVPIALCRFCMAIVVYSELLLWENAKVIATSDRFERNIANKKLFVPKRIGLAVSFFCSSAVICKRFPLLRVFLAVYRMFGVGVHVYTCRAHISTV